MRTSRYAGLGVLFLLLAIIFYQTNSLVSIALGLIGFWLILGGRI
jgi:hypothetical protein